MNGLERWRYKYDHAGMATIPLRAGSKAPVQKAWQVVPHFQQWLEAGGAHFRGNIGVRLGEGIAVIDADNALTVSGVRDKLAGLGLTDTNAVQTKRGRHYYLRLTGVPEDFNFAKLRGDLDGELRAGAGAYCVAPCSQVNDHRYRFVSGSLEDLTKQRSIRWQDLLELVRPVAASGVNELSDMPVRLVYRDMPTKAAELLRWLAGAERGEAWQQYATRSEAEAAVVAMLLLSGWLYEDIARIFRAAGPGHYQDAGKHKDKYLNKTYINVIKALAGSIERQDLAACYQAADLLAWPGRAGISRLKTAKALLSAGWQWNTYEPAASIRYISEHGSLSFSAVHKALSWLESADLIDKQTIGSGSAGTEYNILPLVNHLSSSKCAKKNNSHNNTAKGLHEEPTYKEQPVFSGEVLAGGVRVGASAGMVYRWLREEVGVAVGDLVERTGKHDKTVRSALRRLAALGLAVSEGGRPEVWRRGPERLSRVAYELGAPIVAKRLKQAYERDREVYREVFTDEFK